MQVVVHVLRARQRPFAFVAPLVRAHHVDIDGRLAVQAVVDAFEVPVEPAQPPLQPVRRRLRGVHQLPLPGLEQGAVRPWPDHELVGFAQLRRSVALHVQEARDHGGEGLVVPAGEVERRNADAVVLAGPDLPRRGMLADAGPGVLAERVRHFPAPYVRVLDADVIRKVLEREEAVPLVPILDHLGRRVGPRARGAEERIDAVRELKGAVRKRVVEMIVRRDFRNHGRQVRVAVERAEPLHQARGRPAQRPHLAA